MSEDYKKPFIPIWMEQSGFTLRQYRVLGHLWSRGQGKCYPSLDLIAKSCGIRRGTVCTIIKELESAGCLTRRKRKSKGIRFANEYILTGPPVAPIKSEPEHLEHRLAEPSKAPDNKDTWSTWNDTSVNESPVNDTPLYVEKVLPTAETVPSKKNHLQEMLHAIWKNTPPKGRERSSRKLLEDALKRIPAKERPGQAEIIAALEAWKVSESWIKDDGQYVSGIHKWVTARKWESPPEPATQKQKPTVDTRRRPSNIEE